MFYVYTYFIDDVPRYVGKGVGGRWKSHHSLSKRNKLANTLRSRYRKTSEWIKPLIENCESEEAAFKEEVRLIAHYGRLDLGKGPLWNLTDGGEGTSGNQVSEQTKAKIRRAFSDPSVKAKHSAATSKGMGPKKPKKVMTKRGSKEFCLAVAEATKAAMQREEVKAKLKLSKTDNHRKSLSTSHMKLTIEQIRSIYHAEGLNKHIAAQFGISPSHVGTIKRLERQVYRDIIGENL